ncbi:MAG TPA: hypothetical protein ENJ50_02150, partial [Planctomycetaceae bacterium]|nr:hypothetical protein [Planctomycetaceae bacterium]
MKRIACVLILVGAVSHIAAAADPGSTFRLFVAPNGNDQWSGTLPSPNDSKTDGPFATLQRARDA